MTYIENPVFFFKKIESLIYSIRGYINEREEKEGKGILLFKTPTVLPNVGETFIRAFHITKEEESEVDKNSAYEILHHFHLCQFSLDNENYADITGVRDNPEIQNILCEKTKLTDYKLYIRDITRTFYTIITPSNEGYLSYINSKDFTTTESDLHGKITLYYHNFTAAFYVYKHEFNIATTPDDLDTITYATFLTNENGDISWKLTPLTFDDIIFSRDDFFENKPRYPVLIEQINNTQKKYIESFEHSNKELDLWGKHITLGYEPQNLSTAVLSCGLDYLLKNDELHTYYSQGIFEKLIKNTVEECKMFNLEKFAKNFQEAAELYWGENSSIRSSFEDTCRHIPQTMLMHTAWYEFSKLDIFEADVIGINQVISDASFLIPQLSTMQYVEGFVSIMSEGYEKAVHYQQDVDNFGNGFEVHGIGRNTGEAIGSFLAANFVGAAAQTAYSIYKASKIDSKKYNSIFEEFMVTKASQEFFKELIEIDLIYLILKCYYSLNDVFVDAELFKTREQHIDYKKVFESYIRAYKLYTIALAKHIKLAFVPVYDGFEEAHKKTSKELMQEALLEFPYYTKYYEKYIEFGGEMTEELKTYALAHMVDINVLYDREKEKAEKKLQEKAEQERKKEEKKRLKAEKQKQEEERIKKELSSLSEYYGDLPIQYPEIFKLLIDNPIHIDSKDAVISDHNKIADRIFNYVLKMYPDGTSNLFSGTSSKFNNKKNNIKSVYGSDKIKDNNVVMLFDITIFGSAKDGFVITNENICVHNSFEQPYTVAISDIRKISIKDKILLLNDKNNIDIAVSCVKPEEFIHIFVYCICNLLYLAKKGYKVDTPQNASEPHKTNATNSNQFVNSTTGALKSIFGKMSSSLESLAFNQPTWKCSCGMNVSTDNKFCPNCGTKQPENINEWICSCGKKNPNDSNFCGQCGAKKPQ